MHFNKDKFMKNFEKVKAQIQPVEQLAQQLKALAIKRVFFVGSGGAFTKFVDMRPMLVKELKIPFLIVSPEELLGLYMELLNNQTLVVAGTKTGETTELIETLARVRKTAPEVKILTFVGDDETSLDKTGLADFRVSSVDTDIHLILFGWLVQAVKYADHEKKKAEIIAELMVVGERLAEQLERMEDLAAATVKRNLDANFQMWVGSGRLWGEVCCFSNYMLEEIQWKQAQAVHSSEFFHGPLELIEDSFTINVVLNSSDVREQDERVKRFVETRTKNYTIIDMAQYKVVGIDEEMQQFVEPYLLNHFFDLMLRLYEKETGKSAKTRRYYRVIEY